MTAQSAHRQGRRHPGGKEADPLGVIGAAIYTADCTVEDAKAAFRRAGCAEADTACCSAYLGFDDGVPECCRVEFCWGGSEYGISCHGCTIPDWECGICENHQAHSGGHHGTEHHKERHG